MKHGRLYRQRHRVKIGRVNTTAPLQRDQLDSIVRDVLFAQPVLDMHTHVCSPLFGSTTPGAGQTPDPTGLFLWGIDDLVTYHYLVAEVFRVVPATKLPYEQFWKMSKQQQADHIWKHLFVERTPISEACRGVLTTLSKLGLDPNEKTLDAYRKFFAGQNPSEYVDRVMQLANVSSITMTNEVFDDNERNKWLTNPKLGSDPRFNAVLRIDLMLNDYPNAARRISEMGYDLRAKVNDRTIAEGKRFLNEWIDRMKAIYIAVSLAPTFRFPADPRDAAAQAGQRMLTQVVLPVCAERGIPFAMMIGSERQVNPSLAGAGDMGRLSDVASVTSLCREFPNNKFFVTMLARENQHELCVAARKFGNLMVFGCWWFLNNPSLIQEIEMMRFELLGTSFIPQHSDARIIDQLIYKWDHSRTIIARVLETKYGELMAAGFNLTRAHIERDAKLLLEGNFKELVARGSGMAK
jgi:hypothetical protein